MYGSFSHAKRVLMKSSGHLLLPARSLIPRRASNPITPASHKPLSHRQTLHALPLSVYLLDAGFLASYLSAARYYLRVLSLFIKRFGVMRPFNADMSKSD